MTTRSTSAGELVAGRYELSRKLARGGMGEVFAALDRSSGQSVALKRLLPAAQKQRALAARFMREYHALSMLRHPRIIEVYDYGLDGDTPYYTMELLDGRDLGELSPLPYRAACQHLRDVASSLALLHARRLLHRDVSPRNVRCTSDGRCKLLDFGAMMPFGIPPDLTGTPSCIAPEALSGGPLDQRADLYSLGALAYRVLTGRHALVVEDLGQLSLAWGQPITRPQRLVADIPDALDALVMALLSLDPLKRPASAAEVIDWLSAIGKLRSDDGSAVARSFLVGSALIGRNVECAQLRQRLRKTLEGHGSAVLIHAAPGLGGSRLLAEAALLGQTCGLTVVRAVARKQRGASSSLIGDLVLGLRHAAPAESERASQTRPLVQAEQVRANDAQDAATRAELLRQVTDHFEEVARVRPLLVTVDDLENADESSAALVAALADRSSCCALAVVVSHDAQEQPSVLANVRGLMGTLTLSELDRVQVSRLTASLFGDVPNLERMSDWLYRAAAGNPKLTVELVEHLLARGVLGFVEGTWVLPPEIREPVPHGMAEAMMLRLDGVSAEARALAEILSVRRGGASAEHFLELAERPADQVFRALEELVRAGILESAGNEYVFKQEALRRGLLRSLDHARSHQLHSRWAAHLLSHGPLDRDGQLEAGWHLVHTDAELRGAELLAKVGPELVERRVSMAAAVPALERALEVYERHDRPLAQRLHLRGLLVMSSFLFDYRLADRYAEPTLDALYPFTGLEHVERISRRVGKRLGFALALAWMSVRHGLRWGKHRGPAPIRALRDYARSAMGLVGLRALSADSVGTRAAFNRMRMFEDAPIASLATVFQLGHAVTLHCQGRSAEAHRPNQAVLARLSTGKLPAQMSEQERTDLRVGALLLHGLNETYRERSQALLCAAQLERIATPLAKSAALRVSMTYHILRGDRELTAQFRRLLDLNAIQNGTDWQVDWISIPFEGLAAATWSDVVVLRRCLDRLDRLILEVPSFGYVREALRLAYHFRREDFSQAATIGEAFMQRHPPFSLVGWASTYAFTALAHVELGQPERAREICELALAGVDEEERSFMILYAPLEAAHATALALLGRREEAEEIFQTRLARMRACGEHMRAFLMHEYRVKVALRVGERAALRDAIQDMREAAVASGNPIAIALAGRVNELRGQQRSSPRPPGETQPDAEPPRAQETAVTYFLRNHTAPARRAHDALVMLGHYAGSGEGYLFSMQSDALQLAASLDERAPPDALEIRLAGMLAANDTSSITQVELPDEPDARYRIVRLGVASDSGWAGLAALRQTESLSRDIPPALIAEISLGLRGAPTA